MSGTFNIRREAIDAFLRDFAGGLSVPQPIDAPIRRALTTGGKRVRGVLALAAAESVGGKPAKLVPAAAAIEMIHTSSLILDDLPAMDDALIRRGSATLHREFGEDLAILTSVGLLTEAYSILAESHRVAAPRRWPMADLMRRVTDAVGWNGSVAGEAVDLHSEGSALDFGTLEFIHSRKTGALFVASAVVGGMLADAHPGPMHRLEVFAKNLGLAFQITDDVLDATSTPEQLGKDVGKDAEKLTFVKLAGTAGARKLAEELVETSLASIAPLGSAAAPLRELADVVRTRVK